MEESAVPKERTEPEARTFQEPEIGECSVKEPDLRDVPFNLLNFPKICCLALIRLYQLTLSRLLPDNTCRFYPTCSHYAYQAIYKYGVLRGVPMAIWRVLRCNPFNPGGYDPVP